MIFSSFTAAYNCVISQWNLGGKFSYADLKYWTFCAGKNKKLLQVYIFNNISS